MAKQAQDTGALAAKIESDIKAGDIKPFYLLFGKEHFYIDKICTLLIENALPEAERDFGQMIYYGADTTPDTIVSHARQFPMMASRQLIVVREAQAMKGIEKIESYFDHLMPTTVLVICYKTPNEANGKNIDKRTKFYKRAGEVGVVLECEPVKEWNIDRWIEDYVRSLGLQLEEGGAQMLSEACGVELTKIALAVEKLRKVLDGSSLITCALIEENVGMSREYSAFELAAALCAKDAAKAYKIANYFGENSKRYPIQLITAALANQFLKLLRYDACAAARMPEAEIAATIGLNPFIMRRDYTQYARKYPVKSCMKAVAILKEFDYRSKSNTRGEATDGDLLSELVSRLLVC
ncbi:MAG: DNA polymerase III subunit delta [Bacteroidales bacterium]|nr:DNA polymerase III subunit delta [Bacteroidales bacterium]